MIIVKKFIACLLILGTLISSASFAVAEDIALTDSTSFSDSAMEEYVNSVIPNYTHGGQTAIIDKGVVSK